MAHTKAKGTTKLGRDSESKRLGVKIFGGSGIKCGQIIIRQRGTRYMAGEGVKIGVDHTVYAIRDGVVKFQEKRYTNFTGNRKMKQFVHVEEVKGEKLKVKSKTETKTGETPEKAKVENSEIKN